MLPCIFELQFCILISVGVLVALQNLTIISLLLPWIVEELDRKLVIACQILSVLTAFKTSCNL